MTSRGRASRIPALNARLFVVPGAAYSASLAITVTRRVPRNIGGLATKKNVHVSVLEERRKEVLHPPKLLHQKLNEMARKETLRKLVRNAPSVSN
jgi:hypothetical protein